MTATLTHPNTIMPWHLQSRLLVLVIAILLSGCQSFPIEMPKPLHLELSAFGRTTDERIAQHIAHHQYDAAIALIDKAPTTKARQSEREALVEARNAYIADTLKTGNQLIRDQSWQAATDLLQNALDALPNQPELMALDAIRIKQLEFYTHAHITRLHLDESEYLILITPTTGLLAEVFPDQQQYQNAQAILLNRKSQLAQALIEDSRLAVDMNQFDLAQAAFDSAVQLDPLIGDLRLQKALAAHAAQQAANNAALEVANRRLKIDALDGQFESAMNDGNLLDAQRIMEKLIALDGSDPTHIAQRVELQNAIQAVLDMGIKDGDQKYNAGNIKGALEIWTDILPLSPGHPGLVERIARANRFIQRLEELQAEAPENGA